MKEIMYLISAIQENGEISYQHDKDVILVNPIADTKPTGYCYEIFKPLSDEEITKLVAGYRKAFPKVLQDFYKITNGIFLFGRAVSVFGVPVWSAGYKQPVSIGFADGHRTKHCPENRLFFASYQTDPEIQLFFEVDRPTEDMPVFAAVYGNNTIVKKWASFEEWFISEHNRLLEQYNNNEYRQIDIVKDVLREIQFHQVFNAN